MSDPADEVSVPLTLDEWVLVRSSLVSTGSLLGQFSASPLIQRTGDAALRDQALENVRAMAALVEKLDAHVRRHTQNTEFQ